MDTREPVDGRAIEPQPMLHGVGQLMNRDGHILRHAHDVRKLQADEADALFIDGGGDFRAQGLTG